MYSCPLTGKVFKSKRGAETHAAKEKDRREQAKYAAEQSKISAEAKKKCADVIRLNLSNIKDLPAMIVSEAKKTHNIDITDLNISVTFSAVNISPIFIPPQVKIPLM